MSDTLSVVLYPEDNSFMVVRIPDGQLRPTVIAHGLEYWAARRCVYHTAAEQMADPCETQPDTFKLFTLSQPQHYKD